ncbi:uncharacterized protein EV422DRAFT_131477 [Fimicolochytrium jonesii]|uniref:uncharacterized protein n=1 Tax=Fimicolochytrium jonesii TaxID=1396493 RepID=UPI0022FDB603|nr:uncharacterized protein EV422DRAFT_131477 [Fimicolochytrium jonesii]KAI8819058.1 hypothetical protein EV422DRAFT_131477 [Fimicolochytrium jonesii]
MSVTMHLSIDNIIRKILYYFDYSFFGPFVFHCARFGRTCAFLQMTESLVGTHKSAWISQDTAWQAQDSLVKCHQDLINMVNGRKRQGGEISPGRAKRCRTAEEGGGGQEVLSEPVMETNSESESESDGDEDEMTADEVCESKMDETATPGETVIQEAPVMEEVTVNEKGAADDVAAGNRGEVNEAAMEGELEKTLASEDPGLSDPADGLDEEEEEETAEIEDSGKQVVTLSVATIRERFATIKEYQSKHDFKFGGANISRWVREAQHHLYKKCVRGEDIPGYKMETISDILLLNNILLVSSTYLPSFISTCDRPNIRRTWEQMRLETCKRRMDASLKGAVADVVEPFCKELRSNHPFEATWKKHLANALLRSDDGAGCLGDSPWKVLMVISSFVDALNKEKRLRTFNGATFDEDTNVHAILHTLMERFFNDDQMVTVWYDPCFFLPHLQLSFLPVLKYDQGERGEPQLSTP